jgi:hypothetical protein
MAALESLRAGGRSAREQARLSHRDVNTTMIDTYVLNRGGRSPLDQLAPPPSRR